MRIDAITARRLGVGAAALAALVGVGAPAVAAAVDAPHAAGPSFGVNSDGWTVRIFNHDEGANARYVPTTFDHILNAPNVIDKGGASNTVKGDAALFGPADADVTYAVGDGTVRVFLRSDLDGTTHHRCEVTGNAKCIIDPTPADTPVEVHISSHNGIAWGDEIGKAGCPGPDLCGWSVNARNQAAVTLAPDTEASKGWFGISGSNTAPGEAGWAGGRFSKDLQRPEDLHLEYFVKDDPGRRFIATLSADAVGRVHHTCIAPQGFTCDITPSNTDRDARKTQPLLTISQH